MLGQRKSALTLLVHLLLARFSGRKKLWLVIVLILKEILKAPWEHWPRKFWGVRNTLRWQPSCYFMILWFFVCYCTTVVCLSYKVVRLYGSSKTTDIRLNIALNRSGGLCWWTEVWFVMHISNTRDVVWLTPFDSLLLTCVDKLHYSVYSVFLVNVCVTFRLSWQCVQGNVCSLVIEGDPKMQASAELNYV